RALLARGRVRAPHRHQRGRRSRMSSPALVVFRKELRDTLRDRRTLVAMVIVPLLLFPLLMIGMARFSQSRAAEVRDKVLVVAVADAEASSGVAAYLTQE